MEPKSLHISWATLWTVFFLIILAWLLFLARDVVATLLLAIVVSTAFNPTVSFLERLKIPRLLGTLIVYLAALFLIGLIIYTLVPITLAELNNLLAASDKFLGPLSENLELQNLIDALGLNLSKLTDLLFSGNISLVDIASRFLGGTLFVLATFVLSFYLTLGRNGVEKFLIAILPSQYEARFINIYERVTRKIGKWLTGQLFLSLIIGLATFLGLWLLGVKYSLLLGLLAGLLELIPFVGPVFTGSLAIVVALSESVSLAIYALILFIIIQQLENHVLAPVVLRYTTALNPVVILTALLIGGKVAGLTGVILAVPVAVLFQEILAEWTDHKQARRSLGL